MLPSCSLRTCIGVSIGCLAVAFCLSAQDPTPVKERPKEYPPLAPRLAPTDYQAHAQAGAFSIGAEFSGHSVPTPEATYTTEDFVIVEVGLYGPPDKHLVMD